MGRHIRQILFTTREAPGPVADTRFPGAAGLGEDWYLQTPVKLVLFSLVTKARSGTPL
jgi:hypothetical protein